MAFALAERGLTVCAGHQYLFEAPSLAVLESLDAPPVLSAAQKALGATNVGKTISNFANVSAQFMTRYQVTEKLALGGAFKYKSERYGGQPDTAAVFTQLAPGQFVYAQPVPSYVVADFSAHGMTPSTNACWRPASASTVRRLK